MRLRNPPVVEAWIGFRFERRPDSTEAYPESARTYLSKHSSEYPEAEYHFEQQVTLHQATPQEPPKPVLQKPEVGRIRSFNTSKTRCIQFSKEVLVYSAVKTSDPYPGFDVLRDEAFAILTEYVQQIDPLYVRAAAIFYKDIIEISAPSLRIERLADYFTSVPDFPSDAFGDTVQFRYENVFQCPVDLGPLVQTLQTLPSDPSSEVMSFEMTWLKNCEKLDTLDRNEIQRRLDVAHDYLQRCFRASVTDLTWRSFEPQDD